MKKLVFVFFAFLLIACNKTSKKTSSLISFIPQETQVIIKINDLEAAKNVLRNNGFLKNNQKISFFNYFKNLPVLDPSASSESLLCFSPEGKGAYGYTFISKFNPKLITPDSLLKNTIERISYENKTIHKVTNKDQSFFATQIDSILIATSSKLLIENAIRTQKSSINLRNDLKKVYKTSSGENPIVILIDGQKIKNISNSLLPNTNLEALKNFSGWMSLDTTIDQKAMYLNGIAVEKDSLPSTIRIFENTIAQENKVSQITPIEAKGFVSFTYDDFSILKENLAIAQDREPKDMPDDLDELLTNISEISLIFLENESTLALTGIDTEITSEKLVPQKVASYRDVAIHKYETPDEFNTILNPLIKNFEANFYFSYEDFVVFGKDQNTLKTLISNIQNKNVVSNQKWYTKTMEKLADQSSILMMGATKNIGNYISKGSEATYLKEWEDIKDQDYKAGVLQIIKENDLNFAHIHGVFQKNQVEGNASTVTQIAATSLENKLLNKPILVKNHRTKGQDIAVQDIDNNLYLISEKGKIYWKKLIDGTILGDIQQIDIYKNGRYQLVFNTATSLYVIDRDGNDVTPYPKKFENPITQPLALFDYDKNKRYRLVVTQGNKTTMFDAKGEIVTGFKFKGTEKNLNLPPKHIRMGSKDYIVMTQEDGTLTVLDRLGRIRVNVKEKIDFSSNEWYRYKDNFASTNTKGQLVRVDTKGNVTRQDLNLIDNHNMVATNKTLVTLSENKLSIKGKELELEYGLYTDSKIFYINDKIYVTATDIQSNKVYLYDSNGILFPNFPVYGNSVMSLGNMDKDKNLEFTVQGEENSILIYQIN